MSAVLFWPAKLYTLDDISFRPLSLCIGAVGSFGGAGQLGAGGMGFNNDDMAARLQQQTMQMQQVSIT